MFITSKELIVARKEHACTWCAEKILKGEQYFIWKSVDDSWFTSKMHVECAEACDTECLKWGDNEYMAYNGERPERKQDEALQP